MGNRSRFVFEGWRLLRLVGIVFAMFIIIQYIEVPYGNVLSSLLFADKIETAASTGDFGVDNSSNTLHTKPSLDYVNSTSSSIAMDPNNSITSKSTVDESELSDGNNGFPKDKLPSNDTKAYEIQPQESVLTSISPPLQLTSPGAINKNSVSKDQSFDHKLLAMADKVASKTLLINEQPVLLKEKPQVLVPSRNNFTLRCLSNQKKKIGCPKKTIMSISEMNTMMLRTLVSSRIGKPKWSSSGDKELLKVKSLIENSAEDVKDTRLYAPIYRNISMFQRSYSLMEQTLKVYIYKEGDKPVFHQSVLNGIYASEGWFMKLLKANKNFVTKNTKRAHLFYLPFSSRLLQETLYVPNSHSHKNLIDYLNNYIGLISSRYRFWNRTDGADHFLAACHDWAPAETRHNMERSIRSLCNADVTSGFKFGKDVSLPETYIKSARNPLRQIGGEPPSKRKILAFFAGNMHGYLRPLLLEYWQNNDDNNDMKIFGQMAKVDYVQHMKSSKYCICARGYEVNSPRVVEAIFYECVPVMISDNFVPPFFESLNWEAFAVFVAEKDIPELRNILVSIPEKKYREMQRRVKMVQRHFLWHPKPVKYDAFHMILHSIWFTRVFQMSIR